MLSVSYDMFYLKNNRKLLILMTVGCLPLIFFGYFVSIFQIPFNFVSLNEKVFLWVFSDFLVFIGFCFMKCDRRRIQIRT